MVLSTQYWIDLDTLSTGVTYYYRICAVNEDTEGAYAYLSGTVDGLSNQIDLVSSFDVDSSSQNGFNLLAVLSIISFFELGLIITHFRQSFIA
jgi:hypothetical protein